MGRFCRSRGRERGGGGDGDVLRCEACETMSGGRQAFVEMMMPGASVGLGVYETRWLILQYRGWRWVGSTRVQWICPSPGGDC